MSWADEAKLKPWRMSIGILVGLLVGALLWWNAYEPSQGLTQKLQLILVPIAFGILTVSLRNKRMKVGPYDPDAIARNERGRL